MTVGGVESGVVGALEIDLEIGKQIVPGHEVVGIRQAGGLGASAAQMALAAGGNNFAWITQTFGA